METHLNTRGSVTLRPWQAEALPILVAALRKHGAAIDCSDTGVGKTYTAAFAALEVCDPAKRIVVLAPKAILPGWRRSFAAMGVDPSRYYIVNYERARLGVEGVGGWTVDKRRFVWDPSIGMLLADEAHRLRSYELNMTCRLSIGAKLQNIPQLFLSATLAESPVHLRTVGFALGLHQGRNFMRWATDQQCSFDNYGRLYLKVSQAKRVNAALNALLFPSYGTRVKKDAIPGFPETSIIAEALDFGAAADIRKAYVEMEDELAELAGRSAKDRGAKEQAQAMVAQLRARQRVELLKVPGVAALVEDSLDEGNWVAVFCNFRQSLVALRERLSEHRPSIVQGGQSEKARESEIARFQMSAFEDGGTRVILLQIQSGGAGIDLMDAHGNCPREAIIFPPFSASDLRQALGRVHRATSKSKSVQRIIYCDGTVETVVMGKVKAKLANLDSLQDGDVSETKHATPMEPSPEPYEAELTPSPPNYEDI
jgi:hypothetical protein